MPCCWIQSGRPQATADLDCCSCGQSSSSGHLSSTPTQVCICTVRGSGVAIPCCLGVIACQDWIASCPRVSIERRHLQAKKGSRRQHVYARSALKTEVSSGQLCTALLTARHKLHNADIERVSEAHGPTNARADGPANAVQGTASAGNRQ